MSNKDQQLNLSDPPGSVKNEREDEINEGDVERRRKINAEIPASEERFRIHESEERFRRQKQFENERRA